MALHADVLAKLTTTLAGDLELYNAIIEEVQLADETIAKKDETIVESKNKLEQLEESNHKYLGQISNLLARIPVGASETPVTVEQKLQEISDRAWSK